MTDVLLGQILTAIPIIITSIGGVYVAVRQNSKASAKTDARVNDVAEKITGNTQRLDEVHKTVNGNLSAVTERLIASETENKTLREIIARRGAKRSTDS